LITATEIERALIRYLSRPGRLICTNTYMLDSPWESDLLTVSKPMYWQEFEIKLTVADYKADFRKAYKWGAKIKKHVAYARSQEIRINRRILCPKPRQFWFVFPEGMVPVSEVPQHCGVLLYGKSDWREENCIKLARKARVLKNPTKLTERHIFNLALKCATKTHSING